MAAWGLLVVRTAWDLPTVKAACTRRVDTRHSRGRRQFPRGCGEVEVMALILFFSGVFQTRWLRSAVSQHAVRDAPIGDVLAATGEKLFLF